MDPGDAALEAIVCIVEYELTEEKEKTRLMKESLRADQAAMGAIVREREMLLREKDQMLAAKETEKKLAADLLQALDNNNNFDEKAKMDNIVVLMSCFE